jgi:hypothetical protein
LQLPPAAHRRADITTTSYSAPSYAPGHSHVILGPAGTEQDFNYYARKDCRWMKYRAIETGYRKHWRAYRRCLRG